MKNIYCLVLLTLLAIPGCNQLYEYSTRGKARSADNKDEVILCAPGSGSDSVNIEGGNHSTSKSNQTPLRMIVEGFKVIPLSDLNGLASFLRNRDNAVVYGDIIIHENDLASVHTDLAAQGLTIQDAHRYGARNGSIILLLHINVFGNKSTLTTRVNSLLEKFNPGTNEIFHEKRIDNKTANLNFQQIDSILGHTSERSGNLYKHTIRRSDMLTSDDVPINTHLEFNTWASWQGSHDSAVVAGDFMLLEHEVGPVINALAENGFELVDNHKIHEGVSIFSLHYLGFGNAEKLARGLKAALDQQQRN